MNWHSTTSLAAVETKLIKGTPCDTFILTFPPMDDCHVSVSRLSVICKMHCFVTTHHWSLPSTWKSQQSIIYEEAVQHSATGVMCNVLDYLKHSNCNNVVIVVRAGGLQEGSIPNLSV